uniref:Uncharacterized protein n=1 Tax=Cryptococcus bacillisporus CA1280 TaxID=1296109 RepID=A0A0D0VCB7_CRYGA|nr:hypothetical protein I312_05528 [Cryptococcus bacillisporus CA1280]
MISNYCIVPVAVMYTAYTSTLCCKCDHSPNFSGSGSLISF